MYLSSESDNIGVTLSATSRHRVATLVNVSHTLPCAAVRSRVRPRVYILWMNDAFRYSATLRRFRSFLRKRDSLCGSPCGYATYTRLHTRLAGSDVKLYFLDRDDGRRVRSIGRSHAATPILFSPDFPSDTDRFQRRNLFTSFSRLFFPFGCSDAL